MCLGYLGIDQYGQHFTIKRHPRRELCEMLGRQHAERMYVDGKGGEPKHTGYVIGGHWVTVYAVHEWKA